MGKLVFGADLSGGNKSGFEFNAIRLGDRCLGQIVYESLNYQGSASVTINEVGLLYSRTNAPRMTTSAWLFQDSADRTKFYTRNRRNIDLLQLGAVPLREQAAGFVDESYGLTFRLYAMNASGGELAYFDNGFLRMSNILWEFSPDGGDTWYPYYDMPNRAKTNVVLPKPTTCLIVRAISNDPSEWVSSFTVMPITEISGEYDSVDEGDIETESEYGVIKWDEVENAEIYAVYDSDDELVAFTHSTSFDAGYETDTDGWYVIALNVASKSS